MEKPAQNSSTEKHIGIDFGRNITVIAASQGSCGPINSVAISGISRDWPDGVPVIPTTIGYHADGSISVGEEAVTPASSGNTTTFRRLVYYLCENSPVLIPVGAERKVGYHEAGANFLAEIIRKSNVASAPVTFTRPLSAPPQYDEWITGVANLAGVREASTIDIGCAAVLGYGLPFEDDERYVIIEANTDSLEVSVITREREAGADSSPRSRVLGRAFAEFGGLCTDSWLVSEILSAKGVYFSDDRQQQIFAMLLNRCQRGRETLSAADKMTVQIEDLFASCEMHMSFTGAEVAEIFRENGLFTLLDRTIARAFSAARVHGYDREGITAVLMIGELSPFPALQEAVHAQFHTTLVRHDHALVAAAQGAAMMVSHSKKQIRADYALRYWDPVSREHRYRLLVRSGARYPSAGQVARILISAAYDGQIQLGVPLFRISGAEENTLGTGLELVGTPGGLRLAGPIPDCGDGCRPVQVNRKEPTYLFASPPAQKGVPRFELTFTVDGQGYLCLTARDLVTGTLVKNSERVYMVA